MKLRNASLALATMLAALATTSAFDGSSARNRLVRAQDLVAVVSDAPESLRAKRRDLSNHESIMDPLRSQTPPGATSRPSNRDMRGSPSMGGRGMRGGMGGGRMNGGRGRR
jgi:hypothetical protein